MCHIPSERVQGGYDGEGPSQLVRLRVARRMPPKSGCPFKTHYDSGFQCRGTLRKHDIARMQSIGYNSLKPNASLAGASSNYTHVRPAEARLPFPAGKPR